jgi:hypothetical protein
MLQKNERYNLKIQEIIDKMDRKTLKQNINFIILLRAKVKGTSFKEEYLALIKETR